MSFQEFLKEVTSDFKTGLVEQSARIKNRTAESITDEILEEIADNQLISGEQDLVQAAIKLTRAQAQDPEFANALAVVARKALELFPVEATEEPQPVDADGNLIPTPEPSEPQDPASEPTPPEGMVNTPQGLVPA